MVNPQALLAPGSAPILAPDITNPLANVDSMLPPGVSPPRGSGNEAKLVTDFANFVPAGPSAISRQQSHKSERDLELERKMAEFVKKNDSKDIHEDLPKRKKRTFTDYPVYDDRQQKWPSVVDVPAGVEAPPIGIFNLFLFISYSNIIFGKGFIFFPNTQAAPATVARILISYFLTCLGDSN